MSLHETDEPDCKTCDGGDGVALVIEGRPRPVGTFVVSRTLPSVSRRMVGPFIFLDHLGPIALPPGRGFDVRPHPHIGLSTVTYLFDGEGLHKDSLGSVQVISPGDVNVMTAGRGIVHSERSTDSRRAAGGGHHGLQLWVALREEDEESAPSFVHLAAADVPRHARDGVRAGVIFGEAWGLVSPLRHGSAPLFVDAELAPGASLRTPPAVEECGVYVAAGAARIGARSFAASTLVVLAPRAEVTVTAETASRVVLLGGPPLGKRFIDWNFVSSSKDRLQRAKDDWRARRFPSIPTDDVEFEPLPEPRPPR